MIAAGIGFVGAVLLARRQVSAEPKSTPTGLLPTSARSGFSRSRSPRDLLRHAEHGHQLFSRLMSHPAPKKAQGPPLSPRRASYSCVAGREKGLPP